MAKVVDATEIRLQLEAAYSSLRAAFIAVESVMRQLDAGNEPKDAEPAHASSGCAHRNAQNATVMGGDARYFCRDCRNYVYADGREEAPE